MAWMIRTKGAAALLVALTLLMAACGGGGDAEPEETAATTAADQPVEPSEVDDAAEAATESAADDVADTESSETAAAPAGSELPDITIGYLQVLGASEAAQRIENAAIDAVEVLGWDMTRCDAEGVPDQMQTCADTLIDQGVDAILTDGTAVEVISDQLQRAADADIPFVNTGGSQSSYDAFAASFNPNDTALGEVLANWIVDETDPGSVFVSSAAFTAWGAEREAALDSAIEGTDFTVSNTVDVDFADVVGTAADAVTTQLTSDPDTQVIWLTFDFAAVGAGPAVVDRFAEGERPTVATFYANCATQEQMAGGGVSVSVEENLEWSSWVAIDQLAAFFASDRPFDSTQQPTYEGPDGEEIQFSQQFIVLPDDVDAANCEPGVGPYPSPPDEAAAGFIDFFTQKWGEEYGV